MAIALEWLLTLLLTSWSCVYSLCCYMYFLDVLTISLQPLLSQQPPLLYQPTVNVAIISTCRSSCNACKTRTTNTGTIVASATSWHCDRSACSCRGRHTVAESSSWSATRVLTTPPTAWTSTRSTGATNSSSSIKTWYAVKSAALSWSVYWVKAGLHQRFVSQFVGRQCVRRVLTLGVRLTRAIPDLSFD